MDMESISRPHASQQRIARSFTDKELSVNDKLPLIAGKQPVISECLGEFVIRVKMGESSLDYLSLSDTLQWQSKWGAEKKWPTREAAELFVRQHADKPNCDYCNGKREVPKDLNDAIPVMVPCPYCNPAYWRHADVASELMSALVDGTEEFVLDDCEGL